jgi:hypothetical protein
MANHYYTENNTILCKQKHKNGITALARFSYKVGESCNCKNCDRILTEHGKQSENKCVSFEKLGYETKCQWRNKTKCNCIDDCSFKVGALVNVL